MTTKPDWKSMDRDKFVGDVTTAPTEHPFAGIDSLMDGKDRDFRVEGSFHHVIPKGDIGVHCACCQQSTAPTGNPEGGWFDFVENGIQKRRLSDGTVVEYGPVDPKHGDDEAPEPDVTE